jgi:hypothetical protein
MTGADRQWELNRRNFEGRWCGTSRWYLRDGPDAALDLETPSRVIDDTCYAISFSDPDTGLWDGSGLLFAPDGRRRLPLARHSYNRSGQCWQFEGAGGQSSLEIDPAQARWGHELNLFHGRSRSMLVLLWGRRDDPRGSVRWQLDAVGAVPFRCRLGRDPDPPRPAPAAAEAMLEEQRGWSGRIETLVPGQWPSDPAAPEACAAFSPESFSVHPITAAFADRLLCSVPEYLPEGSFRLEVGCRIAPDRFDQLSLHIGGDGRLQRWERRRFSRSG